MNNNTEDYELYPNQFYCPKCFCKRPYSSKPMSVKVRFYYLQLYGNENSKLENVVECKACKKSFDPRILSFSNQNFVKLAAVARRQLLQGSSVEVLKEELESGGLKEGLADRLIKLALA